MRSRTTSRLARLALAASAVTALTATATACGPDGEADAAAGSSSPSATESSASPSASASTSPDADSKGSGSGGSTGGGSTSGGSGSGTGGSSSGGSGSGSSGSGSGSSVDNGDDGARDGYGQACGNTDLTFTIGTEDQAGGYMYIKAKAKPGISCFLGDSAPTVFYGGDGTVTTDKKDQPETIKLTGSAVAYAGIMPISVDGGADKNYIAFSLMTFATDEPVTFKVPSGWEGINKPIVSYWHTNQQKAIPNLRY